MKTTDKETVVGLAFKVLGTSDDVTNCHCCGRQNLKYTVALQPCDADGGPDGEPVYFGTVCAAKAMRQSVRYVREQISAAELADAATRRAEQAAKDAAYSAWLVSNYGVRQPADLFALGVKPFDAWRRYRSEGGAW